VIIVRKWQRQEIEQPAVEESPPPTVSSTARAEHHRAQWNRYAQAFINGGRHIGSFSREAICSCCPQNVERVDYSGNPYYGRAMYTQQDWQDITDALVTAGLMFKSSQGTDLMPGVVAADVWGREDIVWPRRMCPVQRYVDTKATNWMTPDTPKNGG
jgi:hypothetical protein